MFPIFCLHRSQKCTNGFVAAAFNAHLCLGIDIFSVKLIQAMENMHAHEQARELHISHKIFLIRFWQVNSIMKSMENGYGNLPSLPIGKRYSYYSNKRQQQRQTITCSGTVTLLVCPFTCTVYKLCEPFTKAINKLGADHKHYYSTAVVVNCGLRCSFHTLTH